MFWAMRWATPSIRSQRQQAGIEQSLTLALGYVLPDHVLTMPCSSSKAMKVVLLAVCGIS